MASFLKEFPANYLMCDTAVAKNIEAIVAKNKRALVLSVAAEGLDAAARALSDGIQVVEMPAVKSAGWADNAQVFGSILHEWSRGRGAAKVGMGQWKRGSWMHQVIRFLVHTVDLDSSIWPKYFADIRYREHYRYEVAHDFWILASKLFGPPTKVSFDTHRHLASELLATDAMEKNHLDEYVDAEQFGDFIRNVKAISGSHGTSAQVFCQGGHMENTVKVVMKHGPLLQSGLLAVFNHDDQGWKIHPGDAWTNWWPAVLKSCQDWPAVQ
jgi:hypothetical protein